MDLGGLSQNFKGEPGGLPQPIEEGVGVSPSILNRAVGVFSGSKWSEKVFISYSLPFIFN